MAEGSAGLRLVLVSDPASPVEIGRCLTKGRAAGVTLQGDFVYAATYPHGLTIVDVKDQRLPEPIGHFDTAGTAQSVVARGPRIYLVDMEDGFWILEHEDVYQTMGAPPSVAGLQLAAAPNPFNPATQLDFALARAGRARLTIHAADGRLLASLVDADLPAGPHAFVWDGRDAAGRPVPSGFYLARLASEGSVVSRKLMLVK
jgi:hypothetical protein